MEADGPEMFEWTIKNNKVGGQKNEIVQVDGLELSVNTHPSFNCTNLFPNCTFILNAT